MYLGYNFDAIIPNKSNLSIVDQDSFSVERMDRAKEFLAAVKQFIACELDFFSSTSQLKPETVAISILENYTGKPNYPESEQNQAWHCDYSAAGIFSNSKCFLLIY
jgi:hypothetical protein